MQFNYNSLSTVEANIRHLEGRKSSVICIITMLYNILICIPIRLDIAACGKSLKGYTVSGLNDQQP